MNLDFQQKLRHGYLSHRLNQPELVHLLAQAESAPSGSEQALEEQLEHFSAWETDWRPSGTTEVGPALKALGMQAEFSALSEAEVWTPYQRALYRRLSQPDHDPPSQPPVSPCPARLRQLGEIVEENFGAWDGNANGQLSSLELDRALAREERPGPSATLCLLRKFAEVLTPAGLTFPALIALSQSHCGDRASQVMSESLDNYWRRAESLAEPNSLEQEAIQGQYVQQGVAGSCVLLAGLAGLEAERLGSMVTPLDEGQRFRVDFADGDYQVVSELSLGQRLYLARGQGQDRWPALIEMAMAQRSYQQSRPQDHSLLSSLHGLDPQETLQALTGQPGEVQRLDELSLAQLRPVLAKMSETPRPWLCGSRPRAVGDFVALEELYNGVVNGHCYSLQGYTAESDQVTLRNPWGQEQSGEQARGGTFTMSLPEFYSSFRWLAGPQP